MSSVLPAPRAMATVGPPLSAMPITPATQAMRGPMRREGMAVTPKYRQALINDPKGLIERQLNTSLGPTKVKAVVDTVDTVHVVIPYAAAEGELSDADLEKVAGGKQDIKASCDLKAGQSASGNTVTNVKL